MKKIIVLSLLLSVVSYGTSDYLVCKGLRDHETKSGNRA